MVEHSMHAQTSPPVCMGGGTIAADFSPVVSCLPTVGRCGICGQIVPLMYDCQTIAPHAFHQTSAEAVL